MQDERHANDEVDEWAAHVSNESLAHVQRVMGNTAGMIKELSAWQRSAGTKHQAEEEAKYMMHKLVP